MELQSLPEGSSGGLQVLPFHPQAELGELPHVAARGHEVVPGLGHGLFQVAGEHPHASKSTLRPLHPASPRVLPDPKPGGEALGQSLHVGHHAHEPPPGGEAFQDARHQLQGLGVQGAEALVQEEGLQLAPGKLLREGEGQGKAREEALPAREGPDLAGGGLGPEVHHQVLVPLGREAVPPPERV